MAETIADQFPWPALLTWEGCASKAAIRSDCTKREVLEFALSICPYAHIPTVLNFIAKDEGIADAAKILSPIIRGLKAKESRIKAGASVGGKKSARTRQSNSKTPDAAKLLQERSHLMESGRSASEVAGILAQRYGVHPSTIRLKLKRGEDKAG
ncbi:hypothetical protein D3C71_1613620 [compost metagenome]